MPTNYMKQAKRYMAIFAVCPLMLLGTDLGKRRENLRKSNITLPKETKGFHPHQVYLCCYLILYTLSGIVLLFFIYLYQIRYRYGFITIICKTKAQRIKSYTDRFSLKCWRRVAFCT